MMVAPQAVAVLQVARAVSACFTQLSRSKAVQVEWKMMKTVPTLRRRTLRPPRAPSVGAFLELPMILLRRVLHPHSMWVVWTMVLRLFRRTKCSNTNSQRLYQSINNRSRGNITFTNNTCSSNNHLRGRLRPV
jgi:hypothetical protein